MSNPSPYGSIWRKWDLHFHTPSSYDYAYESASNEEIVAGLIAAGVEVVAITDHHRIDPVRIAELQRLGGDQLTVLPGIEIRSELGGSESVHFIGIFSQISDVKDLWTRLSGKLDITEAEVARKGDENIYCQFMATCRVIHELGGLVSVHAGKKSNSIEGLKSSDYIKRIVKKDLVRDCIDIYEIAVGNDIVSYEEKVFPHLEAPLPLVLCSDNHDIRSYHAKLPLWIKGDKSFEALRQTLYEPSGRVAVSPEKPIAPLLTVRGVTISFPDDTLLETQSGEGRRADPFCFAGKTRLAFSPYLTCLIGGRGSGKSTLLNLLHEKVSPNKTKFFSENTLSPPRHTWIESCVSIDGDTEQKALEFLQQNEIEQFATEPLRLTDAIFSRLTKLDREGKLAAVENELLPAMAEVRSQGDRLNEHNRLTQRIKELGQELISQQTLVASFENEEYKTVNAELGRINRELQSLKNWRVRLDGLITDIRALSRKVTTPPSDTPNLYESEFHSILRSLDELARPLQERGTLDHTIAREGQLTTEAAVLKQKLDLFLRGRGLSPENLADVGKANERVVQIDQELPALKAQESDLAQQIAGFKVNREIGKKYASTVTALLAPLNQTLSGLSKEVKPIELRYDFDTAEFRQAMLEYVQGRFARETPRIDHLESMLEDVDFMRLSTQDDFLSKIPSSQATAKALRDYFSEKLNFDLLVIEAETRLMDFGAYGRVRVSYDQKPVERSSFGQRCTAAIVILLLLGNTPIFIDEPEAHLDSALIANYLVELVKKAKLNRQIVFATHNANFVVNGDAELIHVLDMGEDKRTRAFSTTIENTEHRARLLALEGGKEAFQRRERRYGIR